MSLHDNVVELAITSRARGLDPSWRLMAMTKKRKSTEFPRLPASHTCHTATEDTSRCKYMLRCVIKRRLVFLPCSICDFLLLSSTTIWLTDHPRKFRHYPQRNTNATLKGSIIAENPRNFRSMLHPIYRPSSDGKQFEVMYSNATILSPHSQIFNLHCSRPADFQARSDLLHAIVSPKIFR